MLSSFPSTRTQDKWRTITNPALWLLVCLISTIITLIITIIINATVVKDGNNDYSYGTGWSMMLPMPIIALIWTSVALVLCRLAIFHPVHAVVLSVLVAVGLIVTGGLTIGLYEWDTDGSWAPGVPMLFAAILYIVFLAYAARAVHHENKIKKSNKRMSSLQGVV